MIAALVVTGLLAGIGITAVGPGGVLATVGLFVFTSLTPAQIAGTAIVTHVATGILGSAAFVHSGQLREPGTRRVAGILAAAAIVGTPLGVLLNSWVSTQAFGIVLGGFALVVAVFVGLKGRERAVGTPVAGAIGAGSRWWPGWSAWAGRCWRCRCWSSRGCRCSGRSPRRRCSRW
ncbi:sulfite exporter TauE/SafE family protein [Amycolatopsis echigonensis]|uniref:sulfite exporter TauE/SafE family protein n=1 Tax=Amycolatopsis echigonensis TaxID=2576905 RepID=UPI0028A7D5FE|nr:sulfite exporter TauE/SafE family protein [Amycolatopsis echigonensis]